MTKSKHDLANVTISILVDFDKKIAIFDFDFKIVTTLDMFVHRFCKSSSVSSYEVQQYVFSHDMWKLKFYALLK